MLIYAEVNWLDDHSIIASDGHRATSRVIDLCFTWAGTRFILDNWKKKKNTLLIWRQCRLLIPALISWGLNHELFAALKGKGIKLSLAFKNEDIFRMDGSNKKKLSSHHALKVWRMWKITNACSKVLSNLMMERKCWLCWNVENQWMEEKKKNLSKQLFKRERERDRERKKESFTFNSVTQAVQDWSGVWA